MTLNALLRATALIPDEPLYELLADWQRIQTARSP